MAKQLYGRALAAGLLVCVCAAGWPAEAWTPKSQVTIGREAARLAPADLRRQLAKHKKAFEEGINSPFRETDPSRHAKNADGSGQLDRVIQAEVSKAIAAIRGHQPFPEVVRQLGVVSHFVADANNPLATAASDREEGRYFADFLRYAESAESRLPVVFYGVERRLDRGRDLSPLIAATLARGRSLYPLVGREYRRIGFAPGSEAFDDRSTAFGVVSLALSHAVTDVTQALRHIWLQAGGADDRSQIPERGTRIVVLPRISSAG
jgi:hypothetical protein